MRREENDKNSLESLELNISTTCDRLFAPDILGRVKCFLLDVCEPSRLPYHKNAEDASDHAPGSEVPNRTVHLQRRINHELKRQRDDGKADALGGGCETRRRVHRHLWNV